MSNDFDRSALLTEQSAPALAPIVHSYEADELEAELKGLFIELFETVVRLFAQGLKMPYGFVWDLAIFGGVTARIELVQVDRAFARYRQLLVDKMRIEEGQGQNGHAQPAKSAPTAEQILGEIRDYCRETRTAESTFGRLVVNDGKLVSRLRDGAKITTGTLDKVRTYLSEHRTASPSAQSRPSSAVRPKAPMLSPRASAGSHFCLSDSSAYACSGYIVRLDCTDSDDR